MNYSSRNQAKININICWMNIKNTKYFLKIYDSNMEVWEKINGNFDKSIEYKKIIQDVRNKLY